MVFFHFHVLRAHTYIHKCTHICNTYTYTHIHAHTHMYTHTHMLHTYIHSCTHIHVIDCTYKRKHAVSVILHLSCFIWHNYIQFHSFPANTPLILVFTSEWNSLVYMGHIFFIHQSIGGHQSLLFGGYRSNYSAELSPVPFHLPFTTSPCCKALHRKPHLVALAKWITLCT